MAPEIDKSWTTKKLMNHMAITNRTMNQLLKYQAAQERNKNKTFVPKRFIFGFAGDDEVFGSRQWYHDNFKDTMKWYDQSMDVDTACDKIQFAFETRPELERAFLPLTVISPRYEFAPPSLRGVDQWHSTAIVLMNTAPNHEWEMVYFEPWATTSKPEDHYVHPVVHAMAKKLGCKRIWMVNGLQNKQGDCEVRVHKFGFNLINDFLVLRKENMNRVFTM